jgi:hypothetical protein
VGLEGDAVGTVIGVGEGDEGDIEGATAWVCLVVVIEVVAGADLLDTGKGTFFTVWGAGTTDGTRAVEVGEVVGDASLFVAF